MPFNVSEFRAKVRDFARQYLFEMEILFPQSLGRGEIANWTVEASAIPGRIIEPIDVPFMGQQYKVGGMVSYDPWTITFRIDDGYEVYKLFRAWSELVHGTESNIAAFPSQYKSNPIVYQLDAAGNRLNKITLNGAWPSSIGEVAITQGDSAVQTLDVTFDYDFSTFEVI